MENASTPPYINDAAAKITLAHDGKPIPRLFIGLNWGAIQKKTRTHEDVTFEVDLDSCLTTFDANGNVLETIYFNHLRSDNKAIEHFGDDVIGDTEGDDGLDNEVIKIDFEKLSPEVSFIYIYLISANSQDLGDLPYTTIRLFEGQKDSVSSVLTKFQIAPSDSFRGNVAVLMGRFLKGKDYWEFEPLGKPMFAIEVQEAIDF
ncbi:MAG: TerD family protein, partial [Flammeovirgaceae bacterium]|nr:TerD family protein [Flammeovirgaceae bacterium]